MTVFAKFQESLLASQSTGIFGKVQSISGIALWASGLESIARIGQWCRVRTSDQIILGETIATTNKGVLLLPFGDWQGVAVGDTVELIVGGGEIYPDDSWIGSVVDAFGRPVGQASGVLLGNEGFSVRASPPPAFDRRQVGEKIETKIKCIDVFTPICRGQRLGIFAGSGVGKSTLMAMLARYTSADVVVIALVGERGREVKDFITDDLGPEGLRKSIVIVSTGDEPPLRRRQAAYTATAVAEYFRRKGLHVLFLFDSVTRFAMAQREIGLASGEPPTTKGYTPTVFSELSQLLERAGPGPEGEGDITGVYTVLVDGDDLNEPISDAVRGILDGHLVLDRKIAEQDRYPAVNIQQSISRMLPSCHTPEEYAIMAAARKALARYADMEDLIRVGAYREGSNGDIDAAIAFFARANKLLSQLKSETMPAKEAFVEISQALREANIEVEQPEVGDKQRADEIGEYVSSMGNLD